MKHLSFLILFLAIAGNGFAQDPTTAAPTPPTRDAADVISLFSDAYTDIAVNEWSTTWDEASIEDVQVDGNDVKKITFVNFLGVDFSPSKFDASGMTHFHIDFWTPDADLTGKVFNPKWSNHEGGSVETNAFEYTYALASDDNGKWVSIDVPLSAFNPINGTDQSAFAQFLITSNLDVAFIDNLYLYNDGTGGSGGSGGEGGASGTTVFSEQFNVATSVDGWTEAGNSVANPAEVTFEWDETAGVDGTGAMRYGGTNADGSGGRAYIVEKVFTGVDFAGATDATVSVSIKSEGLVGTNLAALTDIGGNLVNKGSLNADLSETEFVTYTFEHTGIPAQANSVKIQFNVAAGATQGDGGTILIDSLVVTTPEAAAGGELLTNGDFEAGNDGSWTGNALDIREDGGNSYNFADVATAGAASDVNLSQILPIVQGETYVLSFDASTSAGNTRTMVAGIGLNEAPWTAATESVTLTETTQTFTLTLSAAGFGGANSRVLFDMGAETGVVVIDNVSLTVGEPQQLPAPTTAAPVPPTRNAEDVISIFSNAYTNVNVTTFATDWSEGSTATDVVIDGDDVKQLDIVNFNGIQLESSIDLSQFTHIHMDYWVADALDAGEVFNVKLSNHGNLPGTAGETDAVELTNPVTTSNEWVSLDVELSTFNTVLGSDAVDKVYQLLLSSAGTLDRVYIDNLYFYKGNPTSNEDFATPEGFALNQNYPNPFNPSTNISYNLPSSGKVTLEVFNIQGQRVATLVNTVQNAGAHSVTFDASNLASGVYTYRLVSGNSVQIKKMLLIK